MGKTIDLTGRRFGLLTITCFHASKLVGGKARRHYHAVCDCGNKKIVLGDSVRKGLCKSCGCLRRRTGENNPKWLGYGEISGNNWDYLKVRCDRTWGGKKRTKKIPFSIDIKYAWNLFIRNRRRYALTGIELYFGKSKTASLDRIDSSKGYVKGNVQWVHKTVNLMKQSLPQTTFIEFCKKVAQCQANT